MRGLIPGRKVVAEHTECFLEGKKAHKVITLAYPYVEVSMRCDMTVAMST